MEVSYSFRDFFFPDVLRISDIPSRTMYNSLKILSGFFQISEGILQKYAETVDNSSKFVRDILEIFNNIDFFFVAVENIYSLVAIV